MCGGNRRSEMNKVNTYKYSVTTTPVQNLPFNIDLNKRNILKFLSDKTCKRFIMECGSSW